MQEPTRGVVFSKALKVVSEYFTVSLVKASRHIRPAESHAFYATVRCRIRSHLSKIECSTSLKLRDMAGFLMPNHG